jgi:hypothetical protein
MSYILEDGFIPEFQLSVHTRIKTIRANFPFEIDANIYHASALFLRIWACALYAPFPKFID